jgi:hypothetical protein
MAPSQTEPHTTLASSTQWIGIVLMKSRNSNKREGHLFCSHKYHKINNYFIFEQVLPFFVATNVNIKNYFIFEQVKKKL